MTETIEQKQKIKIYILAIIVFFLCFFISVSSFQINKFSFKKTCASFSSQKNAQENLKDWPNLNGDKDGIACESYPYKK